MSTSVQKKRTKNIRSASDSDQHIISQRRMNNVVARNRDNDIKDRLNNIAFINSHLDFLNEKELEMIKFIVLNSTSYDDPYLKKVHVVLDIVNKILIEMGKKKIYDLCDFTDIYREEIIKD